MRIPSSARQSKLIPCLGRSGAIAFPASITSGSAGGMRRGDLVTVALHGDQGKPLPALVAQADRFVELGSVSAPITGTLIDAPLLRVTVEPSGQNGLTKRSQITVASRKRVYRKSRLLQRSDRN